MPLTKRSVSPVTVSLNRLPHNVRNNELECVANGTLANLVRQLSSLSRHAEDIFGELYHEAVKLDHKTNTLLSRVDRLALKVTQLDSSVEEVSLQDLHLRKPFKSSTLIDQQSLSRQTLPTAMGECYTRCDPPPELNKLNPFREDGVPGLKSYTDPEYFFRLWKEEMLKDGEQAKKIRHAPKTKSSTDIAGKEKKKARNKAPMDHRQKVLDNALRAGNLPPEYQAPEMLRQQAMSRYSHQQPPQGMIRPETLDGLPKPVDMNQPNGHYGGMTHDAIDHAHHPRVSVNQPGNYGGYQYNNAQNRPVTSQYMPAGHLAAGAQYAGGADLATPTAGGADFAASPAASSDSGRSRSMVGGPRPNQPPPAPPPPPGQWQTGYGLNQTGGYGSAQNGDVSAQFRGMQIAGQQPPMIDENGRAPSPDLPPPPPPLSPQALAHMTTSTVSNATEKLPSPPPQAQPANSNSSYGINPAPPASNIPPPPPPPPLLNGGGGIAIRPAAKSPSKSPGKETSANQKPASRPPPMDARSELLAAIHKGISLKKVDRQEEKKREKEAQEGHDVAAILRKRMEDVMGTSDSDESRSEFGEEDEWDE